MCPSFFVASMYLVPLLLATYLNKAIRDGNPEAHDESVIQSRLFFLPVQASLRLTLSNPFFLSPRFSLALRPLGQGIKVQVRSW